MDGFYTTVVRTRSLVSRMGRSRGCHPDHEVGERHTARGPLIVRGTYFRSFGRFDAARCRVRAPRGTSRRRESTASNNNVVLGALRRHFRRPRLRLDCDAGQEVFFLSGSFEEDPMESAKLLLIGAA